MDEQIRECSNDVYVSQVIIEQVSTSQVSAVDVRARKHHARAVGVVSYHLIPAHALVSVALPHMERGLQVLSTASLPCMSGLESLTRLAEAPHCRSELFTKRR